MSSNSCPSCRGVGTLALDRKLVAGAGGKFSLAGVQTKFTAQVRYVLECSSCGWSVTGHIEGRHFVADVQEEEGGQKGSAS